MSKFVTTVTVNKVLLKFTVPINTDNMCTMGIVLNIFTCRISSFMKVEMFNNCSYNIQEQSSLVPVLTPISNILILPTDLRKASRDCRCSIKLNNFVL